MKKIRVAESNFRQRKKNVPFQPHNPKLCLFHLECIHWVFCSAVFVRRPVGLRTEPCRNTAREQTKTFFYTLSTAIKKNQKESRMKELPVRSVPKALDFLFRQRVWEGESVCLGTQKKVRLIQSKPRDQLNPFLLGLFHKPTFRLQ